MNSAIRRNWPYIRQQLYAAVGNSSVVVKFVCLSVCVGYILSFSETATEAISVTPGYFIPPNFRIW